MTLKWNTETCFKLAWNTECVVGSKKMKGFVKPKFKFGWDDEITNLNMIVDD